MMSCESLGKLSGISPGAEEVFLGFLVGCGGLREGLLTCNGLKFFVLPFAESPGESDFEGFEFLAQGIDFLSRRLLVTTFGNLIDDVGHFVKNAGLLIHERRR